MFLALSLIIIFTANTWLAWTLGAWSGVIAFLIMIPVVIMLTVGGAIAIGLIGMLFAKRDDKTNIYRFLRFFLKGWGWLICTIMLLPWLLFAAAEITNDYFPATLPEITITNGEKTIVFQAMMHIASPEFYAKVRENMTKLTDKDYVYFYEGVQPGSPTSLEKLSTLMGTDISADMYDTLATIAGLEVQNEEYFSGILPSTNVDLTTDQIVALAGEKDIPAPGFDQEEVVRAIQERYPKMSVFEQNLTKTFARAMMNIMLRMYNKPEFVQEAKNTIPAYEIILDERNKHLATTIKNSPNQYIYIHYGALHFAGTMGILESDDPKWHEVSRIEHPVIYKD